MECFMNYSKLLLLPLIFISSCTCAYEVRLLNQKKISQQAAVIEAKVTRDRYIVYGLTALSIAQQIYPLIALFNKGGENAHANQDEKLSMVQSIKAAFSHLLYTKEGWVSMVQAGVSLGGSIVISNVCNKFVHPDTLRWYVHSYAPYTVTIAMIKEQLVMLQDESCDTHQATDSKRFLHLLYDRLVRQGEAMCAYMVYKNKRLDDEEKEIAQRAARTLLIVQNHYLHDISAQLNADDIDYQGLDKMLCMYEEAIDTQLNHFSIIEGETLEDRHVVRQRVKRAA